MPELREFRIEFENPEASYKPGEIVTGKVIINLSEPKTIREIRVETRGNAKTRWIGESGRYYYDGKENYIRESNSLVSTEMGNQQMTLPAGEHSYYFSIPLPVKIPSSFIHKYGKVRYYLKAVIDRPWKLNHTVESPFTVVSPDDSDTLQILDSTGIHEEIEHDFRSWSLMSAGSIKIDVRSQASAFAPGEIIELKISINNNSQVDVTAMELQLNKTLTFRATEPWSAEKIKSEVLEKVQKVEDFSKIGVTSLSLTVPPHTFVNLEHCSIIDFDYKLSLIIHVSGIHYRIKRDFPVKLLHTIPAIE